MNGGTGACAVCRHQRRKCEPNCELAAYFPATKMNDFRALHLVFGVANLTKLIKANGTEPARRRAAETLTWEAQWRERDPAEGCHRELSALQRDNAALRAENAALRRQAAQCVCCTARHPLPPPPPQLRQISGYSAQLAARASHVYSTGGGDGNGYSICYSNGGGVAAAMRPVAPLPSQMMVDYMHGDLRHAVSVRGLAKGGGNGTVSVPAAGAPGRSQTDPRDRCNTR